MFNSYDMKNFGMYIKNVRISLGFTQTDVSKLTGINSETIRKIENGLTVPKFETLEYLSVAYKQDILAVFAHFRKNQELYELYRDLDYVIASYELERLVELHERLDQIEKSEDQSGLFNLCEIEQLRLIIVGIQVFNDASGNFQRVIDILMTAMQKTLRGFKLDRYKYFKYSELERRILLLMAVSYSELGEYKTSNKLLVFLENIQEDSLFAAQTDLFMRIKVIFNISYNFHELDLHEKSLEYAKKGIALCMINKTTYLLSGLLFRQAVAKTRLNYIDSNDDFKKSIELLHVLGQDELMKIYQEKASELYGYENTQFKLG